MEEKIPENSLDALNASIAKLHEEIAALSAELAGWKMDKSSVDEARLPKNPDGNGRWANFRNRLGEAGTRGEKIAAGLAHEIERHPLIGGMVAFGLGFVIAKLLFKRNNIGSKT